MQGRAMKSSSIALVIVLTAVGLSLGWALLSIRSSVTEMATATDTLAAYANLQRAVADEAFAEASYRRAPGGIPRARIDAAVAEVSNAVDGVRAIGQHTDRVILSRVTLANARYATELNASLDNPAPRMEDRVAGPALDSIQLLLDGAVAGHGKQLATARHQQIALVAALFVVFPVACGAALIALVLVRRVLVRDQNLRQLAAANHEFQSLHDPLTGLANRRLFNDELVLALSPARAPATAAVLFLDLDGFKAVNDTFGHDVGDQLLDSVAERVSQTVRGDLVARLGGDEFAVLLSPGEKPERAAERILAALAEPVVIDTHPITAAASIGIAVAPQDGSEPRDLLRSADAALYRAKAAGKGRWATPPGRCTPALLDGDRAVR